VGSFLSLTCSQQSNPFFTQQLQQVATHGLPLQVKNKFECVVNSLPERTQAILLKAITAAHTQKTAFCSLFKCD